MTLRSVAMLINSFKLVPVTGKCAGIVTQFLNNSMETGFPGAAVLDMDGGDS
jgi:hypothetical protein